MESITTQPAAWPPGLFEATWMNSLHLHYADHKHWRQYGFEVPPHLEARNRHGSNCAHASLDDNYQFYVTEWKARFQAETNHSRNQDGLSGVENIAQMAFQHMMLRPDWWPYADVSYTGLAYLMSKADREKIMSYSHQAVLDMMGYGDERIEMNWQNITQMRQLHPDTTFLAGMELNLLADGNVDTELWSDPRCQLIVLSLHPMRDPGFHNAGLHRDSQNHSAFMAKSLHNHNYAHIWAHPGYSCKPEEFDKAHGDAETIFRLHLNWHLLTPVLLQHNIALEINWSRIYYWACYQLGKLDQNTWQAQAEQKFRETPFLNNCSTMEKLQSYIDAGGLFAINNDGHDVPAMEDRARFAELITLYGQWMDERLQQCGIKPSQVVNTWPTSKIQDWLQSKT